MVAETLQVKGVVKRFGPLDVLRGIDMDVERASTVAVIGPSGSGKSTLVRCINHLEPIQGGEIRVGGTRITPGGLDAGGRKFGFRDIAKFRTHVGMVFQQFNLFPHLTVLENVIEAPIGVLGWDKKDAIDRAMAMLAKVNLQDKAHAYPAVLSGGQQQRAAIIRALIMDPAIMLFDEPTSALDPELKGEVLKVIAELAIRGRTSVIVTHELAFAREAADQVVFMDDGKVVEQGVPADVLDHPAHERTRNFIRRLGARRHSTMAGSTRS